MNVWVKRFVILLQGLIVPFLMIGIIFFKTENAFLLIVMQTLETLLIIVSLIFIIFTSTRVFKFNRFLKPENVNNQGLMILMSLGLLLADAILVAGIGALFVLFLNMFEVSTSYSLLFQLGLAVVHFGMSIYQTIVAKRIYR